MTLLAAGGYYCVLLHLLVVGRKKYSYGTLRQLGVMFVAFLPVYGGFYYAKQLRRLADMAEVVHLSGGNKSTWRRIETVIATLLAALMVTWLVVWVVFPEAPTKLHLLLTGWKPIPKDEQLVKPDLSVEEVLRRMRSKEESNDPNLKWMLAWYLNDPNTDVYAYLPCPNDANALDRSR
jgi:hypothetical protein